MLDLCPEYISPIHTSAIAQKCWLGGALLHVKGFTQDERNTLGGN